MLRLDCPQAAAALLRHEVDTGVTTAVVPWPVAPQPHAFQPSAVLGHVLQQPYAQPLEITAAGGAREARSGSNGTIASSLLLANCVEFWRCDG